MNLNTRCPACETVFKVVPDQLKISSGWVRCGRCAEVFDASLHIVNNTSQPTQTQPSLHSAPTPIRLPAAVADSKPQEVPSTPSLQHKTVAEMQPPPPRLTVRPASKDLSFVRLANNKAFWEQGLVFYVLIAIGLVLLGTLAVQVVYDQRHLLFAKYPYLKESLSLICIPTDCKVEPLKQLEALKIESSALQKVQSSSDGDISDLKVNLKNIAEWPVAVPALELSLTNANDETVVRRVLFAQELKLAKPTLPALSDSSINVRVLISNTASNSHDLNRVSGYRVLAFYP